MRFREIIEVKPNERLVSKCKSNINFDPDKRIVVNTNNNSVANKPYDNYYDVDMRIVVK